MELPKNIQVFVKSPNKKIYYNLLKIYHPDKNNNDDKYCKIITNHWEEFTNKTGHIENDPTWKK